MLQKVKDVVMTIGCSVVAKSKALWREFIQTIKPSVVTGEYIAKGTLSNPSRRAFFTKSAVSTALVACLVVLPSIAFAAVPASVTTAISDAVADVGTIGAAILGVIVVIASFSWMRRPVR